MSHDTSALALANRFAQLETHLSAQRSTGDAFEVLTQTAVQLLPGADYAGITRGRPGRFESVAPTHPVVRRVDDIQYELGSGPCVDAAVENTVYRAGDLRDDPQWPEFGQRASHETGVLSMLAVRLFLEDDDLIAALNVYSTKPFAFDDDAQVMAVLLATHGGIAVTAAGSRERADNLHSALLTNRDIGVAMGVLMSRYLVSKDDAFALLRVASQHSHRKLADIAREVADTGSIELPRSAVGAFVPSTR